MSHGRGMFSIAGRVSILNFQNLILFSSAYLGWVMVIELFLEDTKVFSSQMGDVISPACPGSALGLFPA